MSDTVKLSAVGTLKATLGAGKINVNDYTLTVTPAENGTEISITRGSQTDTVFVPDYAEDEERRVTNENARITNEKSRETAEDMRDTEEAKRQTAEAARADAEAKRTDAETARATAEADRDAAETARVDAESKRVTAESARETAEAAREAAEKERGVDIAELKTDVSAIKAGDTERDTRITAIESKDTEQDTEISTIKATDTTQDASISVLQTDVGALKRAAEGQYELIETITLTEDTASIVRSQKPDGTAYKLKELLVYLNVKDTSATSYGIYLNSQALMWTTLLCTNASYAYWSYAHIKMRVDVMEVLSAKAGIYVAVETRTNPALTSAYASSKDTINTITIKGGKDIPAGAILYIYGIDA